MKGNGERGFCAGLDLKENMMDEGMTVDRLYSSQARLARLLLAMRRIPSQSFARSTGPLWGLGSALPLAAD